MADVLGTAVGVVSLGLQVSQGIVSYYSAYRDQAEEIDGIAQRTQALHTTLKHLQASLRSLHSNHTSAVTLVAATVVSCADNIRTLETTLQKCQLSVPIGTKGKICFLGKKAIFPFRQATLQRLENIVGKLQANVDMAIMALQLNSSREAMHHLHSRVSTLNFSESYLSWDSIFKVTSLQINERHSRKGIQGKMLASGQASLTDVNRHGESILHLCFRCGALSSAILQRSEDRMLQILANFPDSAYERNTMGQTPLHLSSDWPIGLSHLLRIGGQSLINKQDCMGYLPVAYASYSKSLPAVQLLLNADSPLHSFRADTNNDTLKDIKGADLHRAKRTLQGDRWIPWSPATHFIAASLLIKDLWVITMEEINLLPNGGPEKISSQSEVRNVMFKVLTTSTADPCTCACSKSGCTALTILLKQTTLELDEEEIINHQDIQDEESAQIDELELLVQDFESKYIELAQPILEFFNGYWRSRMLDYEIINTKPHSQDELEKIRELGVRI
ncbi:hypothetical protein BGAL_0160g00150 [Botrytis galanthina]|uniref:Fungal N-terminal domain-containing protein n=1 Tax=Botrytis galanthina TaxID=278940 RepID=A0A4S8R114_9HELO|nr:hypothetical protein BGAL_0160g00150 [Botrytis galanthina]